MKRAQEEVRMTKMSYRVYQRRSLSHGAFGWSWAYGNEGKDSGPQSVVGQLPPAPLVHDRALICDTTQEVDGRRNQRNDPEYTTGAQRLLRFTDTSTSGH